MHEGAVRVMAEGAGGRTLPVRGRDGLWRSDHAPAGKTPKTKGRRRQVKGVHGILPDREEVVRGVCQRGHHADQKPWQRVCDEGHVADED